MVLQGQLTSKCFVTKIFVNFQDFPFNIQEYLWLYSLCVTKLTAFLHDGNNQQQVTAIIYKYQQHTKCLTTTQYANICNQCGNMLTHDSPLLWRSFSLSASNQALFCHYVHKRALAPHCCAFHRQPLYSVSQPYASKYHNTGPNGLTKRYTRHCVQKCSQQHSKNLPGEHTITSLQRFQPYNALGEARSGSPQLVIQQILMYTYTGFQLKSTQFLSCFL